MQSLAIRPIDSSMGALRTQASRQALQKDPIQHVSRHRNSPLPTSPPFTSTRSTFTEPEIATPRGSESNSSICSALCVYDFHSDDPTHLPFVKNEILEIIRQADNGWWAALRPGGCVGWIPEAFVKTLSVEVAEKLRNTREELRIYEYDAEQLYTSAPTQRFQHLDDSREVTPPPTWRRPDARDDAEPSSSTADSSPSATPISHRLQRSRDEVPLIHDTRLLRAASSGSTTSPSQYQEVLSPTRGRAGSLPTCKPWPISVNDRAMPPRLSTAKEPHDKNVAQISKSGSDSFPDGLVKRSRSQKLKHAIGFAENRSPPVIRQQPGTSVPWALQPAHSDQVQIDSNGNIWGTLDGLVDKLTTEAPGRDQIQAADDLKYRNVFLMTFRTFTSADTLFDMLVQRYRRETPGNLTTAEVQERRNQIGIQRSVLTVCTMWVEAHRLLEEEPHIALRMTEFLRLVVSPPLSVMAIQLIETIERMTFATPVSTSPKTTPRRRRKSHPHKNDLLKLYTADVAEQLSLFEYKLYANVTPQECIRHATSRNTRPSNLSVFCSTHDKLAAWVKTSILSNTGLGKRADTIDFWIRVAEKCKLLNNFSSMSAVINALSSTVITRLPLTWAHVGRKSNLDALLRHNEPTGGFSGYRQLLQNIDRSCVPFVGMYMTDIVHIQDQFSDESGRISFIQRQRWYEAVTAMLRYQSKPYDIAENSSTLKFIEERLREDSVKDQNWFWSRSREIEEQETAHADIRKGLEAAGF